MSDVSLHSWSHIGLNTLLYCAPLWAWPTLHGELQSACAALHKIRKKTEPSPCPSYPSPFCGIPMHSDCRRQILGSLQRLSGSRAIVVGIATGYGLDDRGVGVRVPVGSRIFSSPRCPDRLWGSTQLPIQWVPEVLSQGVKWLGREADHAPPTSAEVKKMWINTSTCPHAFMV
jgi:hypothetical protein